jgi:outer membrane protein OmpU
MNKYKKIGLTALAASLVSVSAHAGEMSVSGSASINVEGYTGENLNAGSGFSMGNQLTFSGSGELDNGMTVSLSFILDQGDDSSAATTAVMAGAPFDSHSVTVSSDELGTLKFSGEGGASSASSIDTSAAGDIWDTFDGSRGSATAIAVSDSATGNNSIFYTLPELMDGLSINASYKPQASSRESGTGYGVAYTGIDGLTAKYATSDVVGSTSALSGDQTVWSLSYVYGPVTASASNSEYDVETVGSDQDMTSYAISYTVSDEISVTYGTEDIEKGGDATDAEYTSISASYTAGGMTISAAMKEADNVAHGSGSSEDFEYWTLGASFAF